MRICKNCIHYVISSPAPACTRQVKKIDNISGALYFNTCADERTDRLFDILFPKRNKYCGVEGKFFEPIETDKDMPKE